MPILLLLQRCRADQLHSGLMGRLGSRAPAAVVPTAGVPHLPACREPVCLRSLDMSLYRLCLLMEDIGAVALRPTPQRAYITELLM